MRKRTLIKGLIMNEFALKDQYNIFSFCFSQQCCREPKLSFNEYPYLNKLVTVGNNTLEVE